jgi:hypothetical protein
VYKIKSRIDIVVLFSKFDNLVLADWRILACTPLRRQTSKNEKDFLVLFVQIKSQL